MKLAIISTALLCMGAAASVLPLNLTLSDAPAITIRANTNKALCVQGMGGFGGPQGGIKMFQWYIWTDGPWVQGTTKETSSGKIMISNSWGHFLSEKIHKKCGLVKDWKFEFGSLALQDWDHDRYDTGEGLASFKTYKPTTKHCVEAAIRDVSTDNGGLVNMGKGAKCHWTPKAPKTLQELYNIGMEMEK